MPHASILLYPSLIQNLLLLFLFFLCQTNRYTMSIAFNRQSSISARNTCSIFTTKCKPVKQLQELLQQQQEPFILEDYLLERGCLGKKLNSQSNCSCHGNAKKFFKSSVSHPQGSRKGIPHCSRVLQAMYRWVISTHGSPRNKSSIPKDQKSYMTHGGNGNQQTANMDKFYSTSSITVFNSSSNSGIASIPKEAKFYTPQTHSPLSNSAICQKERNDRQYSCSQSKQAVTARKFQPQRIDNGKLLSPISFLEKALSHVNYPLHNDETDDFVFLEENPLKTGVNSPHTIGEDYILPASLWKSLFQTATEKPICADITEIQELIESRISSENLKSKKVLQQTMQPLFDCVSEIVHAQLRKKKQQQQCKEYLCLEELGKLIGEIIESLGKQSGDKLNLNKLLDLDLQDSAKEWRMYEPQRRDISLEIEESILEEIKNETAMEIIHLF